MPATTGLTPLITVITPAYNVEAYIGEALDSILNQSEGRFELIVVDDGSSDATVDVIRKRLASDSRGVLLLSDHGGSSAARNIALKQARGQYVAFLDGDDRWRNDFLEKQLALITSLPDEVGAVYCRARVMADSGQVVGLRWQGTGRCDFDDMLVYNCPPRNGSSLLIKKSCFDEAGLFREDMRSGVDFEMWLRIGSQSSTPIFWGSAEYALDLRIREGAISTNLNKRFESMGHLLGQYGPLLKRQPLGRAYIRPVLLAYRAGFDTQAVEWMKIVCTAPMSTILRDRFGSRILIWNAMPSPVRSLFRRARGTARSAILATPVRAGRLLKR